LKDEIERKKTSTKVPKKKLQIQKMRTQMKNKTYEKLELKD
jgi:hypothetical protein